MSRIVHGNLEGVKCSVCGEEIKVPCTVYYTPGNSSGPMEDSYPDEAEISTVLDEEYTCSCLEDIKTNCPGSKLLEAYEQEVKSRIDLTEDFDFDPYDTVED